MGDPALPLRRFAEKGRAIGRLWAIADVLRAQGDLDYADSLEEAAAHACALAVSLNRAEGRNKALEGALQDLADAAARAHEWSAVSAFVTSWHSELASALDAGYAALMPEDAIPTPSQGEDHDG